jgi:hypothetical protein
MRLRVDFNQREEDGTVWVTMRDTGFVEDDCLRSGVAVELWDDDGDACFGTVMRVEGGIMFVKPDYSTWRDGIAVHLGNLPSYVASGSVSYAPGLLPA